MDFLPKIQIDIVLSDEQVNVSVETISRAARTSKIGDGKIFVKSVEKVVRIRTLEINENVV